MDPRIKGCNQASDILMNVIIIIIPDIIIIIMMMEKKGSAFDTTCTSFYAKLYYRK